MHMPYLCTLRARALGAIIWKLLCGVAQVVAKKRVKRNDDDYAALDGALWMVENASCEAEGFIDFDAADALQYLADEMAKSEDLAQKVLCLRDGAPSSNGLALLVSSLLGASAALLPSGGCGVSHESAIPYSHQTCKMCTCCDGETGGSQEVIRSWNVWLHAG